MSYFTLQVFVKETHLIGPKCNFAATARTTPDVAIVAHVADTIRELRLQTDVTRRVQFHASLLLLLRALSNCLFKDFHLVLLASATPQFTKLILNIRQELLNFYVVWVQTRLIFMKDNL